jgi:hypothetical protein
MNNFYINGNTAFHLEIEKNKGNFVSSNRDETWCNIILDIENEYFKYNLNTEGITDYETQKIQELLNKFLNDEINEYEEYETLEPYITICLNKIHDDSFVEFRINLLMGGCFCGDYYSIFLNDKEDVKKIYKAFNIQKEK